MAKKILIHDLHQVLPLSHLPLPLVLECVSAGFPSPAEDYVEKHLDLNDYLIEHPAATFFMRVEGESMSGAGISSGDMLIVDRAATVYNNSIVVAQLDGEFTVKRFKKEGTTVFLVPENSDYSTIKITKDRDFEIWGVVTFVIHKA